jgi:ADYC domain
MGERPAACRWRSVDRRFASTSQLLSARHQQRHIIMKASSTLALAAILAVIEPEVAGAQAQLTVEGTEFVLHTGGGRKLRSADLVGATIKLSFSGKDVDVRIASVEDDPYAVGGRVLLHHFVVKAASGRPTDMCAPDAEGRSRGFPVPDGRGGFELTCTSGAIGKCVRWGYRPWEEQSSGAPLRALHQACTYMVRADYGGDGRTNTREGTMIDVCDRYGVRKCQKEVSLVFEAAWGPEGATCVARPRIAELASLEQLAVRYPRLESRLGVAACTENDAMRDPAALLFNRSRE